VYIMPALPLFALCAGPWLHDILQRRRAQWVALGFVLLLALPLIALGVQALVHPSAWMLRFAEARQLGAQAASLWRAFVAMGAWMLACAAVF
ncbi:hypothetical protein M1717_26200, partial [Salmonella enterica subsp. enterica serovar Pomona]